LAAITGAYLLIDHTADDHGHPAPSTAVTVLAIALGLAKYRVILRELMDVRRAPKILRRVTDVLVAVIAVALLGTYLVGRTIA
jgi:hypothetical protein